MSSDWPDSLDATALWVFIAIVVIVPVIGYAAMVADIRAYLRSLRRALVVVKSYLPFTTPRWARTESPRCLSVFGLSLPCTDEELKNAYREKVKTLHPDRGGDKRRFLMLQRHFEEARQYVTDDAGA